MQRASRRYALVGTLGGGGGLVLGVIAGIVVSLSLPDPGGRIGLAIVGVFFPGVPLAFVLSSLFKSMHFHRAADMRYSRCVASTFYEQARKERDYWLSLSPYDFEQEVARLFRKLGFQVSLTPATGDRGIDITASRNGVTTIIQCKKHAKPLGPAAVRELNGVLHSEGADKAMMISISGYTRSAEEYAKEAGITSWSIDDLLNASMVGHADQANMTGLS